MRRLVWLSVVFVLTGCSTVSRAPEIAAPAPARIATPAAPATPPGVPPAAPPAQAGKASWYGDAHHGKKTASGEPYDMNALTAAHRTLPLGTKVRVRNVDNGRTVVVRVNDRGPYVDGRVIDLSRAAARHLGDLDTGIFNVRVEVLEDAAAADPPPRAPTR